MSPATGIVYANITLFSPDRVRNELVRLVVDTGSVLTWIPGDTAERLGLEPQETMRFRTIDGGIVHRPIADCFVECQGVRGSIPIVFAREADARVLGVTAMERLGLEVDPQTGTLNRIDAYLALTAAYTVRGSVISP